eukprot:554003_1
MQYWAWVEMLKHDGKKKNEDPPPVPRHLFKRDQAYSPNFVIPVPQENWVVPSNEALAKAGVIRVEPESKQNQNGLSIREKVVYGLLASLGLALISALALFLGGFFDSNSETGTGLPADVVKPADPPTEITSDKVVTPKLTEFELCNRLTIGDTDFSDAKGTLSLEVSELRPYLKLTCDTGLKLSTSSGRLPATSAQIGTCKVSPKGL